MKNKSAFTLVEIMIVVAIIGIIISIAVPAFLRARENARGRACQEVLGKIDGAKIQYALENKLPEGAPVPDGSLWQANGTGYLRTEPACPVNNSKYTIGDIGEDPACPNYDPNSSFVKHTLVGTI